MIVNGDTITAKEFAWDGCHKLYLVNNKEDRAQLKEYGYTFYPINELEECYESSCSLRFIQDMTTFDNIVAQFQEATFKEI